MAVGGQNRSFDRYPDCCPLCGHAIHPVYVTSVLVEDKSFGAVTVELVFQCPQQDCRRAFLGRYTGESRPGYQTLLQLYATAPYVPSAPAIPDEVRKLSPQFADIYTQATRAEGFKLVQVAGCGYRKALEFLIKDYCSAESPGDSGTIQAKALAKVIADHIADANIRACAARATWLGNDETHYVRVWITNDINDLKALLVLTLAWIHTSLLTKRYLIAMPPGGPAA